ncbi:hypothetical protein [Streptomyces specialis]|uniref:hypothetical protein n=1 Tax=Streptomyces specialis TaxID=498367 RepID=UPI00073E669A|nr:hypothetical protein [Streptomyces specialis]
MEIRIPFDEVRVAVARLHQEAATLLAALDSSSVRDVEVARLCRAMKAAESVLRTGTVYALREPVKPWAVRYIGETRTPMSTRLAGHRARKDRPVGKWIAQLGRDPVVEPMELPWNVTAALLKKVEKNYVFHYTWQGADLLNVSYPDDDANAYAWYQECVRRAVPLDEGPWWNEMDEEWEWDEREDPKWPPLHHWRYKVRGAHCPECSARPGNPCALSPGREPLVNGHSNHLRRIAARVRYDMSV